MIFLIGHFGFVAVSGSLVSLHHQSSDGGVTGRNATAAFDHDTRNTNSYQFDGRGPVRQARSVSSVSGDSYEEGHKQRYTGSAHEKSDHDKVRVFWNRWF